jgi:hypothetical protein
MARRRQERADDLDRLRRFLDRARWVGESELVQRGGVTGKLEISYRQGSPWRWTSTEPADRLLEPLLLRIRPLTLGSDDINVLGIHRICEQRLDHAEMRAFLRQTLKEWRDQQRHGIMALRQNERDIRPDLIADLMINGYYFHSDPAKRADLESLIGPMRVLSRHLFIDYVYQAIETVFRQTM